jgi:hypothetical protein
MSCDASPPGINVWHANNQFFSVFEILFSVESLFITKRYASQLRESEDLVDGSSENHSCDACALGMSVVHANI